MPPHPTLRLRIHIPFHYNPQRLPYLEQVLRNFHTYPLDFQIILDTNSPETPAAIATLPLPPLPLTIQIHPQLRHPFDLTWVHRPALEQVVQNYDYFLYLEDDILIPWPAFAAHLADQALLGDSGYLRGFLRLERDRSGSGFLSDFAEPMGQPRLLSFGDQTFIQPRYPYCACWLYSRSHLQDFMASPYWPEANYNQCNPDWSRRKGRLFQREKAAFGMAYAPHPHITAPHRVVLPLAPDRRRIDPRAHIHHLPANYRQDPASHFAKVPVDRIFANPYLWQLHPIALRLNYHRLAAKLHRRWQRLRTP